MLKVWPFANFTVPDDKSENDDDDHDDNLEDGDGNENKLCSVLQIQNPGNNTQLASNPLLAITCLLHRKI